MYSMISLSSVLDGSFSFLYYITSFIFIISLVVFVHEFGHYIVAKFCGVKIESFSIGFGPKIIGVKDRSGTIWKLSAIPLGGYVKMLGDADPASVTNTSQTLTDTEKEWSFFEKPLYKKAAIVAAGPIFNIIFAILSLSLLFSLHGVSRIPAVVSDIVEGSAADAVGFQKGDVILSIDGHKVRWFTDVSQYIATSIEDEFDIAFRRNDDFLSVKVRPNVQEVEDAIGVKRTVKILGLQFQSTMSLVQLSFGSSLLKAVSETWRISTSTLKAVGQIIVGDRSAKELSGPISIARYSAKSVESGWAAILWFVSMLSINLGVINLLPIPVLDGGHLFNYLIEAVVGRRVDPKVHKYAMTVGLALLITLMIFTMLNDIGQIVK